MPWRTADAPRLIAQQEFQHLQRRPGNMANLRESGGIEPRTRFWPDARQPFVGQRMKESCFTARRDFMERGGFVQLDATALTSLFEAMPSLTVILSLWPMALRMVRAISTGGFRRFAVRSK